MDFQGQVVKVLSSISGTGKNGTWKKQEVILQSMDQYQTKIAFEFWGENCRILEELQPNYVVKIYFSIESREHNDRWFTTCKAWKLNIIAK